MLLSSHVQVSVDAPVALTYLHFCFNINFIFLLALPKTKDLFPEAQLLKLQLSQLHEIKGALMQISKSANYLVFI